MRRVGAFFGLGAASRALDDDRVRFAVASLEARAARAAPTLREAEFGCYSQFGEDGIIQWLIARVRIEADSFVEIGTGDYRESNTRFLLEHDNWRGLLIDSGDAPGQFLTQSGLRWRHTVDAVTAFVTRESVNGLLEPMRHIGLLSIDIDGNDYWIWEAVTAQPEIVVVEYNSIFGPERTVTIPYVASFERMKVHSSGLYFGASLAALCHLAARRGYRFVGSNSAGLNAFFVRDDVAGDLPALSAAAGWVESRFRDSRDAGGRLTYISSHEQRRALFAGLELVDVTTGEPTTVAGR